MLTRYQDRAAGSHGFGPTDSTYLQDIRSRLQDLTDKARQIEPAYTVSGRGFRISRVRNYRSYIPTRHQEGTSGSRGFETPDRTCPFGVKTALHDLMDSEHKIVHAYNVSGRNCRISCVGNYRSYMHTRHQEGTSGSHVCETPDRTCLLSARTALHDLMGSKYKIIYGLFGSGHQIEHAYEESGRGCRISRVRTNRFNMPTRYQVGNAGPDR